jgi:hypothetical protein
MAADAPHGPYTASLKYVNRLAADSVRKVDSEQRGYGRTLSAGLNSKYRTAKHTDLKRSRDRSRAEGAKS